MTELLKGRKPVNTEQAALLREMRRLRLEIEERRMRRVRVIQDLHC